MRTERSELDRSGATCPKGATGGDIKHHILPRAVVAVVIGKLLGHLVNVPLRMLVIDQDHVPLALLLVVEELPRLVPP
jgi:hypothetical protein